MDEKVRIVFLGGVGEVTKNMFVYEYWRDGKIADSIIVDCGIGFSETGDEIILVASMPVCARHIPELENSMPF